MFVGLQVKEECVCGVTGEGRSGDEVKVCTKTP